jgi:hypothetical protein
MATRSLPFALLLAASANGLWAQDAEPPKPAAEQKEAAIQKIEQLFGEVERERDPRKPPVPPPPLAVEEEGKEQEDPQAAQGPEALSIQRLEKVLRVELAFLRRVVQLDEQQEKLLAQFDRKWVAKKVSVQRDLRGGGAFLQAGQDFPQPHSVMQRAVLRALDKDLTTILKSPQEDQYLAERRMRSKFVSQASVDAILALLDDQLYLEPAQRDAIRKDLEKSTSIDFDPRFLMTNRRYLPMLPDSAILKHLDIEQKRIYRSLQKVSFGISQEPDQEVIEK